MPNYKRLFYSRITYLFRYLWTGVLYCKLLKEFNQVHAEPFNTGYRLIKETNIFNKWVFKIAKLWVI